MDHFLEEWLLGFVLASPLIISIFTAMFILKNYSAAIYRICWLNILFYFIYSFVFTFFAAFVDGKPRGGFEFTFEIACFSLLHLLFFWIWLYKVKPKKQAETAEKSKILDKDDPILDERPPTK